MTKNQKQNQKLDEDKTDEALDQSVDPFSPFNQGPNGPDYRFGPDSQI